ncbi:MAG: ABA4-like family protein [Allorhizobium sp.]
MTFALLFSIASTAALCGWLALAFLPRWRGLIAFLRFGVIAGLALVYAVLILVFFFRIDGGGFGSIGQVRAIFMSDAGLVAGWIHYLAFDLFIGCWIAQEADRRGYNRLLQVPVLLATFMFGPLGLLIFYLIAATDLALTSRKA